jgi:hypothetical protein
MEDENPITRAGKELLMCVQKSVLELPGSIGWKKARADVNAVLEENAELAEFIDEVSGVSVLQAAAEDKRTQDIAENVVRAVGYGRKQVVNYQGKLVYTLFSSIIFWLLSYENSIFICVCIS